MDWKGKGGADPFLELSEIRLEGGWRREVALLIKLEKKRKFVGYNRWAKKIICYL